MTRIIFLFLFIVAIDWLVFQFYGVIMEGYPSPIQVGFTGLFWSIPFFFISFLLFHTNRLEKVNSLGKYRLFRSFFYLIYLAKFILLFFALFWHLIGLIVGILSLLGIPLFSDTSFKIIYIKVSLFITLIPLTLLIYGMIRNRHRYKLWEIDVEIADLPTELEGLKIVQISDIHSGSFTDKTPIIKGIELINQQKPDLVFFTGDLVNTIADEIEPYIDVFGKIRAKYGVFSILGNHDYGDYTTWPDKAAKLANLRRLVESHQRMEWQLLLNENRVLEINGVPIAIIGVENYSASPRFSKYGNLSKAYQNTGEVVLKLLLSHDPSHWDDQVIKDYKDIAITFSGHTHGAQFGIESPILRWSPVQYFYSRWAGLYQVGKQYLYVNRGFGYLGYPGRVGILPEITCIQLKTNRE